MINYETWDNSNPNGEDRIKGCDIYVGYSDNAQMNARCDANPQ